MRFRADGVNVVCWAKNFCWRYSATVELLSIAFGADRGSFVDCHARNGFFSHHSPFIVMPSEKSRVILDSFSRPHDVAPDAKYDDASYVGDRKSRIKTLAVVDMEVALGHTYPGAVTSRCHVEGSPLQWCGGCNRARSPKRGFPLLTCEGKGCNLEMSND